MHRALRTTLGLMAVLGSLSIGGPARGQDAARVELLGPTIEDLGMLIHKVEGEGYQITDMTLGVVFKDGPGASVPIRVARDLPVLLVGLGDRERILDINLKVLDERGGLVTEDTMPDNMPVLAFEPTRTGTYDAQVSVKQAGDAYSGGFFLMVMGYPTGDTEVVSIGSTYQVARDAVELLEADAYQVLHGEWATLRARQSHSLSLQLQQAPSCRAVAVASPERTRHLDLVVIDPEGRQLAEDRKNGEYGIAQFTAFTPGEYHFVVNPRRLRRRLGDTHAMIMVACQGL